MPQLSDAPPAPKAAGPFKASLVQRAAITVGALLAYYFAGHTPLPGIDAGAAAEFIRSAGTILPFQSVSGFMLGTVPLFSALIFAEVMMLVFPAIRRWQVNAETRATFERCVLAGAVAIAAFQGWGIASGLEGVTGLVLAPGLGFRISTMVAMMAATVLIGWLARFISKYGLGHGFWLLFLTPVLFNAANTSGAVLESISTGTISGAALLLLIAFAALVTFALTGLERNNPGLAATESFIWPPVLAGAAPAWLLTPLLFVLPATPDQFEGIIKMAAPGEPIRLIALALLVPALTYCRQDSIVAAGIPSPPIASPAAVAIVLTAIMITGDLLATRSGVALMPDGQTLIILVSVALGVLAGSKSKSASAP